MQFLIDCLYVLVLGLLKVYRFFMAGLMKLFSCVCKHVFTKELNRIGITLVYSSDKEQNGVENGKIIGDNTVIVHDERVFSRVASHRTLGLGEAYMEGWWDCDNLDQFLTLCWSERLFLFWRNKIEVFAHYLEHELFNLQTIKRAMDVTKEHYDLGNQLFASFLDPALVYTCAYWKNANNLEEAQQHKLELIAQKLKLKPGMTVLELGCGWGALAYHLAKYHGVSVVACNIATEGVRMTEEKCKELPVKVHCQDYRKMEGKFDRVVAVGMMEHVGAKNYRRFYELAHGCLNDGGIFLLQTTGLCDDSTPRTDPFLHAYIFPNGSLPRASHVTQAASQLFTLEDWQNFGHDYERTLMAWDANFMKNWHTIEHLFKNPTKFYRMWRYYLNCAIGGFRSGGFNLWQIVFSKYDGFEHRQRYDAPRDVSAKPLSI